MIQTVLFAAALAACASTLPASADVVISTDATQNMTCSGGVCAPTASDAVLNVPDLENLLASGHVKVTTKGAGVQANNIDIGATFSWSAANALTLDAYQSIIFSAVVRNNSTGSVSLVTNDGGSSGALTFASGTGSLTFGFNSDVLKINGQTYRLVDSVKELAQHVIAKPHGFYALSANYDASEDGVYYTSPIPIAFPGAFNGLGHVISKLEIASDTEGFVGLFSYVKASGSLTSVTLRNVVVRAPGLVAGALAGRNDGAVSNSSTSGTVHSFYVGGLVGQNTGPLTTSWSTARINGFDAGGLVGLNSGLISLSFATGRVKVKANGIAGGLVSSNEGTIENSYATGVVAGRKNSVVGGFVGIINHNRIRKSYSTGAVSGRGKATVAGFECFNTGGFVKHSYWDTTTSGTDQGTCDGNQKGIKGLTSQQLQSGLPDGFGPKIWAEDAAINNGFPYLIANPPQ